MASSWSLRIWWCSKSAEEALWLGSGRVRRALRASVRDGFCVNAHWTTYASEVLFPAPWAAFVQAGLGGGRGVHCTCALCRNEHPAELQKLDHFGISFLCCYVFDLVELVGEDIDEALAIYHLDDLLVHVIGSFFGSL